MVRKYTQTCRVSGGLAAVGGERLRLFEVMGCLFGTGHYFKPGRVSADLSDL